MAKKIINDLKPNDTIWSLHRGTIEQHKIFSISTEEIQTQSRYTLKLHDGDLTSWVFEARDRHNSIQEFHLNKIDVLKLRHVELEKSLQDAYNRQQKYFESITEGNKLIYDSNIEIINEIKNQNQK